MEIRDAKFLEDCLDSHKRLEIILSEEIYEEFIEYLSSKGDITYYRNFPRPLFKGTLFPGSSDEMEVAGTLHSPAFQVILPKGSSESLKKLREFVTASPLPKDHQET
jgi:hypothetical protein